MPKSPMDRLLEVCTQRPLTEYEAQSLRGYITALKRDAKGFGSHPTIQPKDWRVEELERKLADCRAVIRKYDLNKYMD